MRKHEAIDLMKLYSLGSNNGWNKILTECLNNLDINRLAKIRYQIQAGMDDLVKKKLNTAEVNVWFCRLTKSLEITAKRIIKIKKPMLVDQPLLSKIASSDLKETKKTRDKELMNFLKSSSY